MKINSIKIINFQKHSDLTLDFTKDINIIFGSSDVGKSSIRRAIEWTLFNKKIDGIRKQGSKQTSICITLDNGTEIERVRSSSINRYILRKNGEEKVYDAIGKSLPQEIQDEIGINPISIDEEDIYLNSANQISLPFLFDKSPTTRMKLFNALTGNDLLDQLFVSFNKDILRVNRELKEKKEKSELLKISLETKEIEKAKIESRFKKSSYRFEKVKNVGKRYSKLLELKDLEKNISNSLVDVKNRISQVKIPEHIDIKQLTNKINTFDTKNALYLALQRTKDLEQVRLQLSKINIELPYKTLEIEGKISCLTKLKETSSQFEMISGRFEKLGKQIKEETVSISELQEKYSSILKEAGVCPTCEQPICTERVTK